MSGNRFDLSSADHLDCGQSCQEYLYDAVVLHGDRDGPLAFRVKTWLHGLQLQSRCGRYQGPPRIELWGNIPSHSSVNFVQRVCQLTKTCILLYTPAFKQDARMEGIVDALWSQLRRRGAQLLPLLHGLEDGEEPEYLPVQESRPLQYQPDCQFFLDAVSTRLSEHLTRRLQSDEARSQCEGRRSSSLTDLTKICPPEDKFINAEGYQGRKTHRSRKKVSPAIDSLSNQVSRLLKEINIVIEGPQLVQDECGSAQGNIVEERVNLSDACGNETYIVNFVDLPSCYESTATKSLYPPAHKEISSDTKQVRADERDPSEQWRKSSLTLQADGDDSQRTKPKTLAEDASCQGADRSRPGSDTARDGAALTTDGTGHATTQSRPEDSTPLTTGHTTTQCRPGDSTPPLTTGHTTTQCRPEDSTPPLTTGQPQQSQHQLHGGWMSDLQPQVTYQLYCIERVDKLYLGDTPFQPIATPGQQEQCSTATPGHQGQWSTATPGQQGQQRQWSTATPGQQGQQRQWSTATPGHQGQWSTATPSQQRQWSTATPGQQGQQRQWSTATPSQQGQQGQCSTATPGQQGQQGQWSTATPSHQGQQGQCSTATPYTPHCLLCAVCCVES